MLCHMLKMTRGSEHEAKRRILRILQVSALAVLTVFSYAEPALLSAASRQTPQPALPQYARFVHYYQQGIHYAQQRDWSRARASFERALQYGDSRDLRNRLLSVRAQLLMDQGMAFFRISDYTEAANRYQLALEFAADSKEASNGLFEARYRAAYAAGTLALSDGLYEKARDRFRECLEYKPNDSAALERIAQIESELRHDAELQNSLRQADAAIDSGDWNRVEDAIKTLASAASGSAGQKAAAAGSVDTPVSRSLLLYARGDLEGALRITRQIEPADTPSRVHRLREFLLSRRRLKVLQSWAVRLTLLYPVALSMSLFLGLKQELRNFVTASIRAE